MKLSQVLCRAPSALVLLLAVSACGGGSNGTTQNSAQPAASVSLMAASATKCTAMPVSGKTYNIVNEGSGLSLDVAAASKDDGASVIQWTTGTQTNQQWKLTDLGNGSWSIRPVHSDKSLDVYNWSPNAGDVIKQWSYTGNTNQQWVLTTGSNSGLKVASVYSKLFMTIADAKNGSALYQSSDASSAYQRWYFNPVDGACGGSAPLSVLGKSFMGGTKILIGSSNSDTASTKAPFDAQYQYINNLVPKDACLTSCTADTSCGGWWGCWQWDQLPPGQQYPVDFTDNKAKLTWQNQSHPQMAYWTYYSLRFLADGAEGKAEIDNLNDSTKLKRYFTDFRFFLKKIDTRRTAVHLEPDFWGFVRAQNNDPTAIPAKVNDANPTDCPAASHQNNVAGFARCLITMVRKYAPNSSVGLHASPWTWTSTADAQSLGKFMNALGAGDTDFIALDVSDRDAGWYEVEKNDKSKWWDDQGFVDYFAKLKVLTETIGKPAILWQLPLGNMAQNNTYQHYKDNKVEYLFTRINDVAGAHVVGLMFGSGDTPQTYIDTDGGALIQKTIDYWKAGGATIK